MEDGNSRLLEDWNGTDRGDFGSRCQMSVYRMDVWMTRNVGSRCRMSVWRGILAGWMAFFRVDRCGPLRIFFSSSVRVDYGRSVEPTSQMWDVRPVHVASLFWEWLTRKKNVLHNECWVLDEDREEMFFFLRRQRRNTTRWIRLCRALPCSAMFCRVVLRFFPIVLSSVESRCTVSLGFRLVRVVCSPESCSSPCRKPVTPTICNRESWPLSGPSGGCPHCSCRCSISGNCRTRLWLPLCRRSPCGPRRQFDIGGFPVSVKVQSKLCCIYLFINTILRHTDLNERPAHILFIDARWAGFHGFTVTSYSGCLQAFPKTDFLFGPHASRYIASRSARRANRCCSPHFPHVCMPVWA